MSPRAGSLLLLAGATAIASAATAQVRMPDEGLTVDAGAAVRLRPTHLGSDVYTTDFVPLVDGQWGKDLHFSIDDGLQYTAVRWDRLKLGPDLEYRQPYNDKLPPRSKRTSGATELGGFAKVDLTYAELDVRVRKAIDGYDGVSGDISLDTAAPLSRQWTVGLEARFGWADRKFTRNQFVRPALGGPAPGGASVGDYYSAGVQGALIYQWRPKTRFIASVSVDQILRPSRANSDTPTRTAATLLFAVTHRFSW